MASFGGDVSDGGRDGWAGMHFVVVMSHVY